MKPLISVIVPVYKVEEYLKRCVDSIRNQTYKNLEIILVDDGSPDSCGTLCDTFALEDSRIKVIHKQNGGLSSARNAGLDKATGEYIGFVDSDDCIQPQMYDILYDRMVEKGAEISCGGIGRYRDGKLISCFNPNTAEEFTLTADEALKELLYNNKITNSMWDKLYKAEIFETIRMKEGALYEDMQLQYLCLSKAKRVTYISTPFYCYTLSANSILRGNFSIKHYDCIIGQTERLEFYKKNYPDLVPLANVSYLEQCLIVIFNSRKNSEWDQKRKELINAVCSPIDQNTAALMPKKSKIKRVLLKISPAFYYAFMNIYNRLFNK